MSCQERGGPIKTATPIPTEPEQYTDRVRAELAALRIKAPALLSWHRILHCSAIDNAHEPAGEVYITDKGALILDYRRARHVEVCR